MVKMAGIYIHIPFCKQACHYCNFHFSTSLRQKDAMLVAILKEIELSKDYLQQANIETIYFGGGTPSLLSQGEIQEIIDTLAQQHHIESDAEITLEANPDDLTDVQINALRNTPINRFSIGIQSFFDEDLRYMNRAHDANEALTCVKKAQDAGFHNLTIDLIYGTPTMSNAQWEINMDKAFALNVPHISCYCLTVEPKTALAKMVKTQKVASPSDEQAIWQFERLMERSQNAGFDHYEISNFGKPNYYARHNSNYWHGVPYLGIGPSAHSFNGTHRRHNVAHNTQYINALSKQNIPFENEILTPNQQYNEYVMIRMRTIWGVKLEDLKQRFEAKYVAHFQKTIQELIKNELVVVHENTFTLNAKGKLMADFVAMELFY